MTTTADQLVGVAASQIGYFATPGTPTKFGEWYGIPTGYWCAMFVSWCASESGAQDIIPKHAYTPSGVQWFHEHVEWSPGLAGVRRGDIVYFDFPGAPDRVSHVGLVESVNADGSVTTIEGNTSGTVEGNQRNGGLCARKIRRSYIVGFGRPAYADAAAGAEARATGGAATTQGRDAAQSVATQRAVRAAPDGFWGDDTDRRVDLVRSALNGQFPDGVPVTQEVVGTAPDGIWGKNSAACLQTTVAALQSAWDAAPDGIWGPETERQWAAARARNYHTW